MRKLIKVIAILITVSSIFSIQSTASASSYESLADQTKCEVITAKTIEEKVSPENFTKVVVNQPKKIKGQDAIAEYILNSDKTFVFEAVELDVDYLLANSESVATKSSGNRTGTFNSTQMNTGTPNVKWSYKVDYEIEPISSGYGWKFKSVQVTSYVHKSIFVYIWANTCTVTFTSSTYSLNSSRTTLTVNNTLKFIVSTDAVPGPITYYENISGSTTIDNVSPD